MRWRERLTLLLVTGLVIAQARPAAAATTAVLGNGDDDGPTTPAGVGDLLPTPNLHGDDTRTLFEAFPVTHYFLDSDTGHGVTNVSGPVDGVMNALANLLMMINVAIVQATIAITWWVLGAADNPELLKSVGKIVGLASGELAGWLLPSALAIGAAIAYAQHRNASGAGLNQLAWVLVAGVLAVSFTTAPQTWVDGVDATRTIGTDAVLSTTSAAVSGNGTEPFKWEEPAYTGTARDTMLRKSGDAIWRAYAVTPWCLAEFGSLEACERYGRPMLELGTDEEARKEYIWDEIAKQEGDEDKPTVRWVAGESPTGRIGVLLASSVAAISFAGLVIALGFTSLMAFIGALLLLIAGTVFAMLWCIPGAPRRWGLSWFYQLIGLLMQSVLATLIFGSVLVLTTALFSLTASLGWLPVAGLTITVCVAAWRFRRILESVTGGAAAGGAGAGLLGYMAVRSLSKVLTRGRGGAPSAATGRSRRRSPGALTSRGGDETPRRPQRFRELPPPGGRPEPAPHPGGRRVPAHVPGDVRDARELSTPGSRDGRRDPAGRRPAGDTSTRRPDRTSSGRRPDTRRAAAQRSAERPEQSPPVPGTRPPRAPSSTRAAEPASGLGRARRHRPASAAGEGRQDVRSSRSRPAAPQVVRGEVVMPEQAPQRRTPPQPATRLRRPGPPRPRATPARPDQEPQS